MLHKDRPEDLNRALGITLALFNMDLESLVLSLILHTIPALLQATGSRMQLLTDPKGAALAQLTVMALMLLHKHSQAAAATGGRTQHGGMVNRGMIGERYYEQGYSCSSGQRKLE